MSPRLTRAGSYVLIIRLKPGYRISVGRLGRAYFPAGYYVYTGSAMGGLSARIARHLRKAGKHLRWHVDYLLRSPGARVVEALPLPGEKREECQINQWIAALPGALVILPGFGSSDCRQGCAAHLVMFRRFPPVGSLRKKSARLGALPLPA